MPSQIVIFYLVSEIVDRAAVQPTQTWVSRPDGPDGTRHGGWVITLRYWEEVSATYDWVTLAEELYNTVVAVDPDGGHVEVRTQFVHPNNGQNFVYPPGSSSEAPDWMLSRHLLRRLQNV
jgi:hypothetical protein